jgi:hypothetical protein
VGKHFKCRLLQTEPLVLLCFHFAANVQLGESACPIRYEAHAASMLLICCMCHCLVWDPQMKLLLASLFQICGLVHAIISGYLHTSQRCERNDSNLLEVD